MVRMVIVLVHWKIIPGKFDELRQFWLFKSIPESVDGLFGEFLSRALPQSEFNYLVDDLSSGNAEYESYINVGIWSSEQRFQAVVGHLFNDDKPKEDWEFAKRTRTVLSPTEERRGTWNIPTLVT
jgi:hypothetical protein